MTDSQGSRKQKPFRSRSAALGERRLSWTLVFLRLFVCLFFEVLIIRYDKMVSHMMKCHMCIKEVHHLSCDPGIVKPSIGLDQSSCSINRMMHKCLHNSLDSESVSTIDKAIFRYRPHQHRVKGHYFML